MGASSISNSFEWRGVWLARRSTHARTCPFGTVIIATLSILFFYWLGSAFSEASADVSVESGADHVVVRSDGDSLLLVLEKLGEQFHFAVKWYGPREAMSVFNGEITGSLNNILNSLLRSQDNAIIYQRESSSGAADSLRPSEVILLVAAASKAASGPPLGRTRDAGNESSLLSDAGMAIGIASDADRRLPAENARKAKKDIAYGSMPLPRMAAARSRTKLSEIGQPLPDLIIDPSNANIKVTVAIGNDQPRATYIMAHTPAGLSLQQTAPGRWESWDGRNDSLVNNGLKQSNGRITFEIMQGDLTAEFYPLTFAIAYRTGRALKYGVFQAMPEQRIIE